MHTVAFLNRKGGVGKTSSVHHLAGCLAKRGLRLLLVDADPQSSLTQGLLGPNATWELNKRQTIASLFEDGEVEDVVRPISNWIALIPGSPTMDDHNELRPWKTGDDQYVLRNAFRAIQPEYDLCLIDCPPQVDLCSWSALVAARWVVVPLQAEDYGAQGVPSILEAIDHVKTTANPDLAVLGYLLTMFDKRLAVHITYEERLRGLYHEDVFVASIPLAKDFKEAVTLRKTVTEYKPRGAAAKAMEAFTDEFLARIGLAEVKKVA